MELRTVEDVPLIVAGASILIVEQNRLLLERSSECEAWRLPWKSLVRGETMEQVAQKTILEQTGHQGNELTLLDIITTPADVESTRAHQEEVYHVTAAYICKDTELLTDPAKCEINDEQTFFSIGQLPEDLHPTDRSIIHKYLSTKETEAGA